jgi:hypothetical protein
VEVMSGAVACDISTTPVCCKIVGYFDGFFIVPASCCAPCLVATGFIIPWNGRFSIAGPCIWRIGMSFFTLPMEGGGRVHLLDEYPNPLRYSICGFLTDAPDHYLLQIAVPSQIPANHAILWQGKKFIGNGAEGTYARTGGCDMRATIDVQYC